MAFFTSRSSSSSTCDLIAFYSGTGHDYRGRSLSTILHWNASKLESSHDYIQTLFPLPEESGVNWSAPIIDRRVFSAFRSRPELQEKLRESFSKILWFYGFKLLADEGEGVKVIKGENYTKHVSHWDSRFDHNHLRITRIIRCLRVLGLEDEALAFRAALEENLKCVSPRSREYWRRAAERGLNLRPDLEIADEGDDGVGPGFLREFEKERKVKLGLVEEEEGEVGGEGGEGEGKEGKENSAEELEGGSGEEKDLDESSSSSSEEDISESDPQTRADEKPEPEEKEKTK
ncbi:hypothetical protein EG329_004996 [Mollisiaceae sp. DMI_Dod_QoI]|nr:hypothetical protein EG329_004996 [Helotiales sp. DMI_Dod_QoI]